MDKIDIITNEPSLLNKILQIYWVNPKSWLLKEFHVDGNNIRISTKNNREYVGYVSETTFKYQKDAYDRIEFFISETSNKNNKIHFKEIPGMLEDEEWKCIVDFCNQTGRIEETKLGVVTRIGRKIVDGMK